MVHPRALTPILVGREQELAVLREQLLQAERGQGRLVLIGGDAGVGKTRLVREFVRQAKQTGPVEVLEGPARKTMQPSLLGP